MMKRILVAGVALMALAACNSGAGNSTANGSGTSSASLKDILPPAGTQWATTVVATPEGGFRMGNPDAPVKLIEYGSLTCPACAAFAQQGFETLRDKYVASGRVSLEFRSFLLHGPDLMATMVLQCGGPAPFFTLLEASYADMQNWLGKISAMSPADQQRIQGLPIAAQNTALAQMSGLDQFAIQRGVGSDAVKQCLADPAMPDKLLKVRNDANAKYNIPGTPTFILNDKVVPNVASWSELEPELRAAGA